ncbi:unnamed protein product, partial [Prunus brigantina]
LNINLLSTKNTTHLVAQKLGLGLWVSMNWVITHTHCHWLAGTVHRNQTLHFVTKRLGFVHWDECHSWLGIRYPYVMCHALNVGDTKGSIEELYVTVTELQSTVTGLDYKLGSISEKHGKMVSPIKLMIAEEEKFQGKVLALSHTKSAITNDASS